MKLKILLGVLALISVFCVAGKVVAMTPEEKQAMIANIQQQIAIISQQLTQMLAQQQGSQNWCYTFNSNLGYPNSGTFDVVNLHLALQKEGIGYSPDGISTYSTATAQAVSQFQAKYGISPQTGYVGPKTRSELNQFFGCSSYTNNNYYNNNNNNNTTNDNGCKATCATQGGTVYAVACDGSGVTECTSGESCELTYDKNSSFVNGVVQTTQTLTGSECTSSYNNNNNSNNTSSNTCSASCRTQPDGVFAIDCNGYVTKCNDGDICQQTFDTNYVNNNGSIQTVKTLTGSECIYDSNNSSSSSSSGSSSGGTCIPYYNCTWSDCVNNQQILHCVDSYDCGGTSSYEGETQTCNSSGGSSSGSSSSSSSGGITCYPSYTCTWSTCTNNQQIMHCVDSYNCGIPSSSEGATQTCNSGGGGYSSSSSSSSGGTTCAPVWSCLVAWGTCASGQQTRTCTSNNCGYQTKQDTQQCCSARCYSNAYGTWAIDCDGTTQTKCDDFFLCRQTTTKTYINYLPVTSVSGSECYAPPAPVVTLNVNGSHTPTVYNNSTSANGGPFSFNVSWSATDAASCTASSWGGTSISGVNWTGTKTANGNQTVTGNITGSNLGGYYQACTQDWESIKIVCDGPGGEGTDALNVTIKCGIAPLY